MDVSKQEHYEVRNPQPIDVAIAWELDYLEGNVLKYLGRWRFKNGVEDLEKMVDYAQRLLKRERDKKEPKATTFPPYSIPINNPKDHPLRKEFGID